MKCPKCGYENEENISYCIQCGEDLSKLEKFCPKCGEKLSGDATFCSACGTSLSKNVEKRSRTLELVLGILGGVFGLLGAVFAIFVSAFGESLIFLLGLSAFLASIVGIIGSIYVRSNAKYGGIILIIASVWLLISISLFGSIGFIFLLVAGICALLRK